MRLVVPDTANLLDLLITPPSAPPPRPGGHAIDGATQDQLRGALDAMARGHLEFVTLEADDGRFVQAAGQGGGPYELQRCDGDPDGMVRAAGSPDSTCVATVMSAWLAGAPDWDAAVEWQPLGNATHTRARRERSEHRERRGVRFPWRR